MPYSITEPHPSVNTSRRTTYLPSGRGGAGNISRYDNSHLTAGPSAKGPASISLLPPTSARALTGRGGAGNVRKPSDASSVGRPTLNGFKPRSSSESSTSSVSSSDAGEQAIFSFDEELARDQRMRDNAARTPVYHIGRGGAGNAFVSRAVDEATEARRRSIAGMVERISRTLSRN